MVITRQMTGRNTLFLLFVGLSILIFYAPMKLLVESSFGDELYSHIIFIPLVSIYLIYTGRREKFQENVAIDWQRDNLPVVHHRILHPRRRGWLAL